MREALLCTKRFQSLDFTRYKPDHFFSFVTKYYGQKLLMELALVLILLVWGGGGGE